VQISYQRTHIIVPPRADEPSGQWVGDCFIYVNNSGRLNYSIGGQIEIFVRLETSATGQTQHTITGYLAKEDRVHLVDKSLNIISLAVLQYQMAVMRGDFDAANELLPNIPELEYTKVALLLRNFLSQLQNELSLNKW